MQIDDQGEWLQGVKHVISPNCNQRPAGVEVDLLVIHSISLPPNEFGGGFIDQLFTNSLNPQQHPFFEEAALLQVSAHVMIDRGGSLTQYVPFTQSAWHAGVSEFEGKKNCNDYSIGIELEGCDSQCFTQQQYDRLIKITGVIIQFWPKIIPHRIVGHCHIAIGRKTDPGPMFDWQQFYAAL